MNNVQLKSALREGLDRHAESLDAAALNRLHAGRQAALAQLGQLRWYERLDFSNWMPLSLAVATGLLIALLLLPLQGTAPVTGPEPLNDATILAYDTGLDLYDEIEFYLWLDAESS